MSTAEPVISVAAASSSSDKKRSSASIPDDASATCEKRVCMSHIDPIDAEDAITVNFFMRATTGNIPIGPTVICRACRCHRCRLPLVAKSDVFVSSIAGKKLHLFHSECASAAPVSTPTPCTVICEKTGVTCSVQKCKSLILSGATGKFSYRTSPSMKCSRCNWQFTAGDKVLGGPSSYCTEFMHVECGQKCGVLDCSIATSKDTDILCRYHAPICSKCAKRITCPGSLWCHNYSERQLYLSGPDFKHIECASAAERAFAAKRVECGKLRCADKHVFYPQLTGSYYTAKTVAENDELAEEGPLVVLMCQKKRCSCCGATPNFARDEQKCYFVDDAFFCENCFCGHDNYTCDGHKLKLRRYDGYEYSACVRHIGPGWDTSGKPYTSKCIECGLWVRQYNQDDGCDIETEQGNELVHHSCLAARRQKEAERAAAAKP